MDRKLCASSDCASAWSEIDWATAERYVKKLQARIVKAQKEGRVGKVKGLTASADHILLRQSTGCKTGDGKHRETDFRGR